MRTKLASLTLRANEDIMKQERELHNQILIYNLVNGLYLNEAQMEFILGKEGTRESPVH